MIGKNWSRETLPGSAGASAITATMSRPQPNTTVCAVTGKISRDATPLLRDVLTDARRDDNAHLVIDLSAVTSMDATGLYVLFEALNEYNLDGGRLAVVVDPHSQAIHELHIFALEAAFDLYHKLARALHACANTGTVAGRTTHQTGACSAFDERLSPLPLIHQRRECS